MKVLVVYVIDNAEEDISFKQRCTFLLDFWCNMVIEHDVEGMLGTTRKLHNLLLFLMHWVSA